MTDPILLDVRGTGCASVLIQLARLAGRSRDGHLDVVVWTDDLGAPEELPAWCRMTGHAYLGELAPHDGAARHSLRFTRPVGDDGR